MHIIDSVVLPADMEITPAKLMRGSKQRTMGELMVKAGLGWILDGREPSLAELQRVGLDGHIRARPQDEEGGGGGDASDPDPNEYAHPSYTILMPTDKAFSRENLTHYLSDEKALLDLLKLHIIPSNLGSALPKASLEHAPRLPPRDGLPLALEDDVVYPTLLAPTARYGELAFRMWGETDWYVGVHNARGGSSDRGGRTSAAGRASVRWKKAKTEPEDPKDRFGVRGVAASKGRNKPDDGDAAGLWRGGMTLGGGVVVIDTVLIPYDPGWFERWGLLVLTIFGVTAGVSLLGVSTWWWYTTTRRRREGYERVAQEEEARAAELEQEQANRQWRRQSRSEARRPIVPPPPALGDENGNGNRTASNSNGNGNGNGNGISRGHSHPVEDEYDDEFDYGQ
jgi:hypothetical protein